MKQGYLFEIPVQKWSRSDRAFKKRLLALTKSSVVEMDVATRFVFLVNKKQTLQVVEQSSVNRKLNK